MLPSYYILNKRSLYYERCKIKDFPAVGNMCKET